MPTTSYTEFTAGVRALGGRTDAAGAAVGDYSAEEDRFAQAFLTEGALTPGAFVVQADANMDLAVGSGSAKADLYAVQGDVAGQGTILVRLDQAPVTVTIPAADPAQPRIDEVYLVVADQSYDGGSLTLPRLSVRKGDAGGGAPGPDAGWEAAVLLASVDVGAAVTSITSGDITDERGEAGLSEILSNAAVPAGATMQWLTNTAPTGWLIADGSAVSRTTFARLFGVIGTTFGIGDGSTTFNLPNLKGRVPVGRDAAQTEFDTLGETGGEKTHVLTDAEMPSHTHTGPSHTHTDPAHSHGISVYAGSAGAIATGAAVNNVFSGTSSTNSAGGGQTGASGTGATGSAGSDDAHNNLQPYVVLNYIVKA